MGAQHTPAPWHVEHLIHIKAENGWRIASVNVPSGRVGSWGVNPSDNARFIVHAVNCHDELLAALEPFSAHVEAVKKAFPSDPVSAGDVCRRSVSFSDFERAAAAIAKARGEVA